MDLPPNTQLPAVPEDITASWLSSVLDQKVTSVHIRHIIPGTATKVFITVTYGPPSPSPNTPLTLPTTLCVKGGFNPALVSAMPFVTSIYRREVDFYNRVAPSLRPTMSLPTVHWAGHTPSQGILIMDDLSSTPSPSPSPSTLPAVTFGTPTTPWALPTLFTALTQLAALHAKTWNPIPAATYAFPATYPWLPQESHYDAAILHLMQTYEAVVRGPDRPPGVPEYMKSQERMTAVLRKHYATGNPRFLCLVHGDAHVSNTYLVGDGDGGTEARFLDWQMVHVGSAFHDVAYLIAGAMEVEVRREREWECVAWYLGELARFGGPKLEVGDEEVRKEYKKGLLAGVGPIMCPYEMQPREWVWAVAGRYAAALDDHGVLELVEGE